MASKVLWFCLASLRSVPVIFITAIIVWSYYAYVVQMCIFSVQSTVEKVLYLIFYHPFVFMMAWSYWQAIFTSVYTTPKQFFLSSTDLDRFLSETDSANRKEILDQVAKNLPVQCRTITGEIRFCEKCKAVKPDRAHHCSMCGKCVLKMDHHCPWVNNCVNFSNYKFFLLFLGYALAYCLYVAFTSLQYFIRFWMEIGREDSDMSGLHVVFLFIVGVLFTISLLSLFGYHCFLVAINRSTIEAYQAPVFPSGPDKQGFNLGCYNNFVEVFGREKRFWLLPIFTSVGDGTVFPSRTCPTGLSYHSMETTEVAVSISETVPTSIGDGLAYPVRTIDEDYDSLLGQRQRWTEEVDGEIETSRGYFVNEVSPDGDQS